MNIIPLYLKIITTFLVLTSIYGFVVPTLISTAFTLANLLGVVIAVIVPIFLYKIWFKKPKTQTNNND
jgi:hypothetical protein